MLDIVDDFTSMSWSIPMKNKKEAFLAVQAWEKMHKNETGLKAGKYHTGFDGELNGMQMQAWLESQGIENEHSTPNMSAHIGKVKQMHRMLMENARAMKIDAKCPEFL